MAASRPGQRHRYAAPRRGNPAQWVALLVAAVLLLIVLLAVLRRHAANGGVGDSTPVPAGVLSAITAIPAATFDSVGATGVYVRPNLILAAVRPTGAPTVLYMGGEFCPFCAATRWPLIAALSRFGRFSGLTLTASSSNDIYPDTPTFSFVHARYSSASVELQTVELSNRDRQPLQSSTKAQAALMSTYDQPKYTCVPGDGKCTAVAGQIPFVLIGGRYIWPKAPFDPGLLAGRQWPAVAANLAAAKGAAAQAIVANANEFAAAICAVNGGKPASVCTSGGVRAAAATLPG